MKAAARKYGATAQGKATNSKKSLRYFRANGRFAYAKAKARVRGKTWTLSKEEFLSLVARPCEYCQGPIAQGTISLDRLDNARGYEPDNVVPCCALCNYARRDQFTPDEMRRYVGPAIRAIRLERGRSLKVTHA